MKKTIYSLLLAATLGLTACSDWLDVSPKTEEREDDLFATEEGCRSAVSGVYILLGKEDLYGVQATMFVPEFLAHTWETPLEGKNATAYHLAQYDYENSNVETTIDNLWSNYYNAIVQINNILSNVESRNIHFAGNNKAITLGEMYGLRAFLHLDLLRLFGPVPDQATGSASCIPYVKEMTTDVAKLQSESYDQVKADILADLDKAEELLGAADPLVETAASADAGKDATVDLADYELYRQLHFNYWAVLGTKARYYYWTGDKDKAVAYAQKVINAKDKSGNQIFTLCDEAYFSAHSNANYIMKMEHLFGVYNSNINDAIYTAYYGKANCLFTQDEEYIATAYESALYPDDIRNKGTRYWSTSQDEGSVSASYHYTKYFQKGSSYGAYTIPALRLSEMYFIVFEDAALDEMKPLFATWRLSRGLDASVDGTLTSASAVQSRMEKEWRKEFMGEGQMFYFYKKHNYATLTWPTSYTVPQGAYQIPKPKSQTMYE